MSTRSDAPSIPALAQALTATFPASDDAPLARALLGELALGEPVPTGAIVAATGRDATEVSPVLARWPKCNETKAGESSRSAV